MSHPPARAAHHRRPPDAWARIRTDYASGVPARVAAERGGVSVRTLRARAREEGWRRQDGCGPPPPADWSPALEAGLEGDAALLAEEAWLNAARFLHLGRLSEASAWARMAAHCRRAARDADREEGAALAALPRILGTLARSMNQMPTPEGEQALLRTFEHVLDATNALHAPPIPPAPTRARSRPPEPVTAPECKSQAPDPQPLSAELHHLHTPATAEDRVPLPRACSLGGGQPRSGRRGSLGHPAPTAARSQDPFSVPRTPSVGSADIPPASRERNAVR